MLILEIAAGIILAALLWRYWESVVATVFVVGFGLWLWLAPSKPAPHMAPLSILSWWEVVLIVGGVVLFALACVGVLVLRDRSLKPKQSEQSAERT